MTARRESSVEAALVAACRKRGWMAPKWTSPGTLGVPDRIILADRGRVFFVEVKRPGGKPRPSQIAWHARAAQLGHTVWVYDGTERPDGFLDRIGASGTN